MMTLLHLLSYVGGLAGFLFVTLSLASGLLWLAELIEEHSKYAKVIGMRAIYTIIVLHILLFFTDSLPFLPISFSIICHLVYLQNFSSTWPYISLTSPRFILSCILVVADHFTWFFHFASKAQEAKKFRGPKYRYGGGVGGGGKMEVDEPAFMDVAAFFAICVWFVPLFLFLSLSANDNALPSLHASAPPSPTGLGPQTVDLTSPALGQAVLRKQQRSSTSLIKSLLVPVVSLLPRLRSRRRNPEGIIAPRTPVRGSPLHSPVTMPANYFPWGEETNGNGNGNSASSSRSSLSPDVSRSSHIGRSNTPPPPPRRVQSETQTQGLNPRGIAVRNGVPAIPDSVLTAEPDGMDSTKKVGLGISGRSIPKRPESPSMSLGPTGLEKLGGAEIVERPKKKND